MTTTNPNPEIGTCKHGHPRTEENTIWYQQRGYWSRKCKVCRQARRRTGKPRTGRPRGSSIRKRQTVERLQRGDTKHAACQGADPALFFRHEHETGDLPTRIRYAADNYCRRCPIRTKCRGEANAVGAVGLWGGDWIDEQHRATPLIQEAHR